MNKGLIRMSTLALACAGIGLAMTATAAPPAGVSTALGQEKAPERSARAFDRAAVLAERHEYHQWLESERVARGKRAPILAAFGADEIAGIDNDYQGGSPRRVGLTRNLAVDVGFGKLRMKRLKGRSLDLGHGAIAGTRDGGYVYTMDLGSPQASALRVQFSGFSLPRGAGLFLYTDNGQVFGPYTGRGPHGDGSFWSHTVMGESVRLQLRQLGPADDRTLRAARFKVAGLGHLRPKFMAGQCSNNASCVESASCGGLSSAVNDAVDAVAHMQWVSGQFIFICSGGLLADTDNSTERPLFLSANHCISRNKDARNLENFFQLTTSGCSAGMSCDDIFDHMSNHPQNLRTLGASILSTGRNTDYTLFELNDPAPGGSAFLGWTSTAVAFSNNTPLFRISHPDGSPQAYSEQVVDTSAGTCSSWPRGDRIYSRDTLGATEGGSSGSPVVNAAGQVVGQLSGACGTNVNDVCDAESNATVDGAFAAYFGEVESILDPPACTPEPEVCDDGIDNDCDGAVDGDDSDCDGGGGGQPGDSCMADNECASNKCKGKPGARTCR